MSDISRPELLSRITRHRNFAGLELDDLDVLFDIADFRTWKAGETVFEAGEPLDGGYILVEGRLEQSEEPYPGRRLHSQSFASGSLFGSGGLVKDWKERRKCVALEDTVALYIGRGAFLRQIDAGNAAAFRIVDALLDIYVKDVQSVNQQLDEIFNRPNETLALLRHEARKA